MLWSVGLFDESDRIKNPQAKTTKSVLRMQVQYRCLLSGLPSPLSRLDLFTQMQFLEGGTWMLCRNFWEWRDRYFEPVGYSWVAKPGTVKAIQEAMTDYAHCRTRKQVGLDNTSVKKVLYVDLPPKVRKAYDKAEKEFVLGDKQTKWKLVTRLWTRRLCSGCLPSSLQDLTHDAKYKELGRLLDGSLKGQQVVVWAFFRREVLAARAWFEKRGESVRCITGDTPVQQRKEYCRLFQTGKVRYLVLQVQTGKYGLNLSNASTAVYLSLSDSLSDLRQSRDRIVHMSKVGKGPNLFVYLLVRDSVEQDQYEVLQERGVEARDVLEQSYTRMLARLKGK
jgi:SWI/SNF-related matrix-associated actin-dependent regulator 1 of chromatin subfamily A